MEFRKYAMQRIRELEQEIRLMQSKAADYARAALECSQTAKRLKDENRIHCFRRFQSPPHLFLAFFLCTKLRVYSFFIGFLIPSKIPISSLRYLPRDQFMRSRKSAKLRPTFSRNKSKCKPTSPGHRILAGRRFAASKPSNRRPANARRAFHLRRGRCRSRPQKSACQLPGFP